MSTRTGTTVSSTYESLRVIQAIQRRFSRRFDVDAYHALSGVSIEVAGWRTPLCSDVREE
jgi:hypothetical protein